jgi:hypothetical protein
MVRWNAGTEHVKTQRQRLVAQVRAPINDPAREAVLLAPTQGRKLYRRNHDAIFGCDSPPRQL